MNYTRLPIALPAIILLTYKFALTTGHLRPSFGAGANFSAGALTFIILTITDN